jgi:hypothetical protein
MSGHGHHDTGKDPHAGHDDHHDETTSDDFPPDEPRSPGWLPLLGAGLFLAAICAFLLFGSDDKSSESTPEAVAPAAATPTPVPAAATAARRPMPGLPPGHVPVPAARE